MKTYRLCPRCGEVTKNPGFCDECGWEDSRPSQGVPWGCLICIVGMLVLVLGRILYLMIFPNNQ